MRNISAFACILAAILLTTAPQAGAQPGWEWEADEGYHQEEWYDPSDWFDTDVTTDYEYDVYDYEPYYTDYYYDDSHYDYYDDDYSYEDVYDDEYDNYGYYDRYGYDADGYDYDDDGPWEGEWGYEDDDTATYDYDTDTYDVGYGYDPDDEYGNAYDDGFRDRSYRDEYGTDRRYDQGRDGGRRRKWEFRGTVENLERIRARRGQPESVRLTLKTQDGKERTVTLGDFAYVQENLPRLRKGESIRIRGEMIQQQGRELFKARQIAGEEGEFDIPDYQFEKTIDGELVGLRKVRLRDGDVPAALAKVRTQDGDMINVLLGSQEALRRQGDILRPGSRVAVRGYTRSTDDEQTFVVQDAKVLRTRQRDQREGRRDRWQNGRMRGDDRWGRRQDRRSRRDDWRDRRRFDTGRRDRQSRMGRRGEPRRALALHKGNALTGTKVVGDGGQRVGKIKDLVLDADQGTLSYVLITADNGSSQCVPVPWQMISLRKDGKVARVNLSPDQFRDAPHADASQVSEKLGADQFNQRIHDYWSDRTPMAMPEHGNPIKLTELIGKSVKTPDGNRVGDIEDILFAVQPGELIYALLSLSDQQQGQDRMAAVPFERISARPNRDTARIDAGRQSIQQMSYRADQEPDLGSRQFARRTQQQFDTDYVVYGVAVYDQPDRQRQRDAGTWQQSDRWSRFRRRRATGDSRSDLQGTIQSVGTFRPEQADWQSVRLKIETEDGQTRTVLVGPKERVEDRFDLEPGDQVRLHGRPARIDGRRVIIARQFSMQDDSNQDDR